MRGLLIAVLILGWLPMILFKPHIGVLVWDWVSHMNPQAQTYGFAQTFQFLDLIAGMTLIGLFLSKDHVRLPAHPIVMALGLYLIWVFITTVAAFEPARGQDKLVQMFKVILFAAVSMSVMRSPNRLKAFVWIMGLSLGYVIIKGGLFTIITAGAHRVQGAGGMISDNNHLAMALAMMVPLTVYFFRHPPHRLMKWPLLGVPVLAVVSVLGTQSRGGLVALAAVLGMGVLLTRRRLMLMALMVPIGLVGIAYMPENWTNRFQSIERATDDDSFIGRVSMWRFSSNLADENPVTGGGFDVFYVPRAADLYMPPGYKARAPHSIYFEVLGEHGYVGLVLFMTLIFIGWYSGGAAARKYGAYKETRWLGDLCRAVQVSVVGFAVGGLTVNIATFDLFYHMLALIVMSETVGGVLLTQGVTPVTGGETTVVSGGRTRKWRPPPAVVGRQTQRQQPGGTPDGAASQYSGDRAGRTV
ncbi:putative O-glycosylation ligase, exosortase A system-associated [Eilatimonas milleporae]|uniref:Putative O-glycosylation ligase (Exosortase A-associated) n=1 Tax=Eilatimonas milleporae TaxID=911205 RepID=A0A3M0BYY1_9PROT|nr:putative O-glycosylation ligase, exosortase A system-associated [Eilatimonas milleporae]RMB02814.1 putative O-glycosylation ligase (exosortase A-associated) [Eilatimonas milleporae]